MVLGLSAVGRTINGGQPQIVQVFVEEQMLPVGKFLPSYSLSIPLVDCAGLILTSL